MKELGWSLYIHPHEWKSHLEKLVKRLKHRTKSTHEDSATNEIMMAILQCMSTEATEESRPGASRGDTAMDPMFDQLKFEPPVIEILDTFPPSHADECASPLPSEPRVSRALIEVCSLESDDFSEDSWFEPDYDGAKPWLPSRTEMEVKQAIYDVKVKVLYWLPTIDHSADPFEAAPPPPNDDFILLPAPSTEGSEGPYTSRPTVPRYCGPTFPEAYEVTPPEGFGVDEAWSYFVSCLSVELWHWNALVSAWNDRQDTCASRWGDVGFRTARIKGSLYVLDERGLPIWRATGSYKNLTIHDLERTNSYEGNHRYQIGQPDYEGSTDFIDIDYYPSLETDLYRPYDTYRPSRTVYSNNAYADGFTSAFIPGG